MQNESVTTKKKLIYFTDTIGIGGAEEYLRILAIHTNIEQFNVRIAIPRNKNTEKFVLDLQSKKMNVDYISKYNLIENLLYFFKTKPDYIHYNLPFPTKCMTAILAGIIYSRSKLYVTEHLVPPEYKPYLVIKLIKKFLYSKLDRAITVSNKNKDVLIKNFGLPESKIKVIYNCVNIDHIKNYNKEVVRELRKKFLIDDSALVFGTVGRLDKQKGHEYLITASKKVIREIPNSIFLFVGMGQQKNQLEQRIKENNIGDHFRLVGYQEKLPEILALIDIFVLPSISEGLPFAVLEAMAAKKPVIATDVGGTSEIIMNNVNGILVRPMDPDVLAKSMILLSKDMKKRDMLAELGYKRIIENFSMEKMLSTTKKIFN